MEAEEAKVRLAREQQISCQPQPSMQPLPLCYSPLSCPIFLPRNRQFYLKRNLSSSQSNKMIKQTLILTRLRFQQLLRHLIKPILFYLSTVLAVSLPAQSSYIDNRINSIYERLQESRKLLEIPVYSKLPADTFLTFTGEYPARKGFTLSRVIFKNETAKVISSTAKKLTLEFNGPVLTKIILHVTRENAKDYTSTSLRLTDATPMDKKHDDWVLLKNEQGELQTVEFSRFENDSKFILDFKRNFYISMLEEFQMVIDIIYSNQEKNPVKNTIKHFQDSMF